MSGVFATVGGLCALLVAVEAVAALCRDNAMAGFVRGLVVTAALLSGLSSLVSGGWELDFTSPAAQGTGEELASFVKGEVEQAARRELEGYVENLLAAAGVEAEKIQVAADIGEDGSIVCTGVSVRVAYPSQGERALALLQGVLGQETEVEVIADGTGEVERGAP